MNDFAHRQRGIASNSRPGKHEMMLYIYGVMTLRGHIHEGTVVLDDPNGLPEGTEVEVAPVAQVASTTNTDLLGDLIGSTIELPPDSSRNKYHYLYGQPKRD
jgi:hypothetical protein